MSDFLTRMVERTLGLSEVVQPFVPAAFARSPVGKDSFHPPQDATGDSSDGQDGNTGSTELHNGTPSLFVDRPPPSSDGEYDSGHLPVSGSCEKSVNVPNQLKKNREKPAIDQPVDDPVLKAQKEETLLPPVTIKQSGQSRPFSDPDIHAEGEAPPIVSTKHKKTSVRGVLPSKGTPVTGAPAMTERTETTLSSKKKTRGVDKLTITTVSAAATKKTSMREKDAINKGKYLVPATEKEAVHPITGMMADQTHPVLSDLFSDTTGPFSPPPTIKVTIGRIDVRAVMQQAPSPKPIAAAAPKLSLDDYLKKRGGGQR
jgi:hypothetical protein